ncbi:YqhV family protein [Shouchella lonarensis]|uniref:YqhV family protein n=1 Tax=Shouchella lonarensis TaxID=1464122 RepID=UPI003254C282
MDTFVAIKWTLIVMVCLRLLSGFIEVTAAFLMLRLNSVEKAIAINATLALVGPTVLLLSLGIGLAGITGKLSLAKFLLIGAGVLLIFIGIRK